MEDPEDTGKWKVGGRGRKKGGGVGIWEAEKVTYLPSDFHDWLSSMEAARSISLPDFRFLIH